MDLSFFDSGPVHCQCRGAKMLGWLRSLLVFVYSLPIFVPALFGLFIKCLRDFCQISDANLKQYPISTPIASRCDGTIPTLNRAERNHGTHLILG